VASNLVALAFDGAGTAEGMLDNVLDMQERELIALEDAVVASRAAGTTEVEVKQTKQRRGRAALVGGGIGLLAGLLIGGPLVVTTVGALIGGLRDKGIDDGFIRQLNASLKPDSSALILLVKEADAEAVLAELRPFKATVLTTTLAPEMEKRLRDALAHEQ
jgi:uncharacterized membrane protein